MKSSARFFLLFFLVWLLPATQAEFPLSEVDALQQQPWIRPLFYALLFFVLVYVLLRSFSAKAGPSENRFLLQNAPPIPLAYCEFSAEVLFSEVVQSFKSQAAEKHLPIYFLIDDNVPHYLIGDPASLRQITANLIDNAIKFTERGQLFVHIGVPYLTGVHCKLRVSVQDTGVGLTVEQQRHIFEPAGIHSGLALCASLIERMAGTIQVESTPGLGSQFKIAVNCNIGRREVLGALLQEKKAVLSKLKPLFVLVAEDYPLNQKLIQIMLQTNGIETVLVQNGELALKQYLLNPSAFQLILMDCEMPICDGFSATKKIRDAEKIRQLSPIPIIALTENDMPSYKTQCLGVGANDVLIKPIEMHRLQATLERWGQFDFRI